MNQYNVTVPVRGIRLHLVVVIQQLGVTAVTVPVRGIRLHHLWSR